MNNAAPLITPISAETEPANTTCVHSINSQQKKTQFNDQPSFPNRAKRKGFSLLLLALSEINALIADRSILKEKINAGNLSRLTVSQQDGVGGGQDGPGEGVSVEPATSTGSSSIAPRLVFSESNLEGSFPEQGLLFSLIFQITPTRLD